MVRSGVEKKVIREKETFEEEEGCCRHSDDILEDRSASRM